MIYRVEITFFFLDLHVNHIIYFIETYGHIRHIYEVIWLLRNLLGLLRKNYFAKEKNGASMLAVS